jgi:hypothetical protein
MKKICILLLLSILLGCREEKEDNSARNALLLLALSRRSTSTVALTGSQTNAELMADSSSISNEDSAETGAMGVSNVSSSVLERAISLSGTATNGTVTITNDSFDCPSGGTVSFEGTQSFSSASSDFYNRTSTLTNGTRRVTYTNCVISSSLTINSGSITFTQVSPDSGSTTMETAVTSGSTTSGTLRRTLTNLKATIKGSMTVTVTGRRGTGTGVIEHDHTLVLSSRVRNWTLTNGRVSRPTLVSRQGTLTGTTKINSTSYTINKTIDVNID